MTTATHFYASQLSLAEAKSGDFLPSRSLDRLVCSAPLRFGSSSAVESVILGETAVVCIIDQRERGSGGRLPGQLLLPPPPPPPPPSTLATATQDPPSSWRSLSPSSLAQEQVS